MVVVVIRGRGEVWGFLGVREWDLLMCDVTSTAVFATIVVTSVYLTIKVLMCDQVVALGVLGWWWQSSRRGWVSLMRVDSPCFTLQIYLQGVKVRGRRMNIITMAQSIRSIV